MKKLIIFSVLLFLANLASASVISVQLKNYLVDTLNSLDRMRGENGLVGDTIAVRTDKKGTIIIAPLNLATSPTNIAMDLVIQA